MIDRIGPHEQALFDAGFTRSTFTHHGATRDVYERGEGPPVIVLSEIPGITPPTLALCGRLVDHGYAVILPQLLGEPGAPYDVRNSVLTAARMCVSHEFTLLALGKESPIAEWLRALCRHVRSQRGARGVGVIGMCLTGNFALAMMVDESVLAPVLSQPSLPLAITPAARADLGIDAGALLRVKQRCRDEDLCVLGLRFTGDVLVPRQRFERLRAELGSRFLSVEIDSSLGNPHGIKPWAHSVLTVEYRDEPGHPTGDALHAVLTLFERQLRC